MRNRISYNTQHIYLSASPATGETMMHYTGQFNDDLENHAQNHNLIRPLRNAIGINFSLPAERENINQLGNKGSVARKIINHPQVDLSFNYYVQGVGNEQLFGLNTNIGQFEYPNNGDPLFADNFQVNLLSGLESRDLCFSQSNDPFLPRNHRDTRNVFAVVGSEGKDIARLPDYDFDDLSTFDKNDSRVTDFHTIGFGNCYLNSWSTSAAINSFPQATVSYTCENVRFYNGGSGFNIPAIDSKTRNEISDKHFVLPGVRQEDGPITLVPGDITIDIQRSDSSKIEDLGLKLQDTVLNSYNINLDLERSQLHNLGWVAPIDRQIDFSVFASFSVDAIVSKTETGKFERLVEQDKDYDITIKLRQPFCNVDLTKPINAGKEQFDQDIAVRYDFLKARLDTIDYNTQVGENKQASLSFSVELDPENIGHEGFYISGLINQERTQDYVRHSDGFIIDDNGNPIVANDIPLRI